MSGVVRAGEKLQWILEGRKVSKQAIPSKMVHPRWGLAGKSTASRRSSEIRQELSRSGWEVYKPSTADLSVFDYNYCRP